MALKEPESPADPVDPKAQKRIRTKYNLIRELVNTEETFGTDIAVVMDVYCCNLSREPFCNYISARDAQALFTNLDQILLLSRRFLTHLRECIPDYILSECDLTPPETEECKTTIEDIESSIGQVILEYIPSLEFTYKIYCAQSQFQLNTFYRINSQASPMIDRWLLESGNESKGLTQAWTLDALLIKPVQRLMKYPLLLNSMLEVTSVDHPDYSLLKDSLDKMQTTANRINSIQPETIWVEPFGLNPEVPSPLGPEDNNTFTSTLEPPSQKERMDYNIAMSRLKDDMQSDAELEILMIQFDRKQRHVKNLIRHLRGNISQVQKHFDSSSALAHSWVNWSSATDDADNLAQNHKNKVYRRFAMFSLPFTTSSSAHVSTNKLFRRVEEEVIDPLHDTWLCYFNVGNVIGMRERYHSAYNTYVTSKAISDSNNEDMQLDAVTLASADNFMKLHNKLKMELPDLFSMTEEVIDDCLIRFLAIQRDWFRIAVDSTSNVFSLTLADIRLTEKDPIISSFHRDQNKDARHVIDEDLVMCHFRRNISAITTNGSGASGESRRELHSSTSSLSSGESSQFDFPTGNHNTCSSLSSTEEGLGYESRSGASDQKSPRSDTGDTDDRTWVSRTTVESTTSSHTIYSSSSSSYPNLSTAASSKTTIDFNHRPSHHHHHHIHENAFTLPSTPTTPTTPQTVYFDNAETPLLSNSSRSSMHGSTHGSTHGSHNTNVRKVVRRRSSLLTLSGWHKMGRAVKPSANGLSVMNEI